MKNNKELVWENDCKRTYRQEIERLYFHINNGGITIGVNNYSECDLDGNVDREIPEIFIKSNHFGATTNEMKFKVNSEDLKSLGEMLIEVSEMDRIEAGLQDAYIIRDSEEKDCDESEEEYEKYDALDKYIKTDKSEEKKPSKVEITGVISRPHQEALYPPKKWTAPSKPGEVYLFRISCANDVNNVYPLSPSGSGKFKDIQFEFQDRLFTLCDIKFIQDNGNYKYSIYCDYYDVE